MTDDLTYYRNKYIQLQTQMTAKDKTHADKYTQLKTVNVLFKTVNVLFKTVNVLFKTVNVLFKTVNVLFKTVNVLFKAKIEENQHTQNTKIVALKDTVSALVAKNLGIKYRKKIIPQKIILKTHQNHAGKDLNTWMWR